MIVVVFMIEVKFLVVDEFFYGLDLFVVYDLVNLIQEKKEQGVGILMLIYVLDIVQCYCDCFVFLVDGKVKIQGIFVELMVGGQILDEVYLNLVRDE